MRARRAGGIPLQIREGKDGELVEPADPEGACIPLARSPPSLPSPSHPRHLVPFLVDLASAPSHRPLSILSRSARADLRSHPSHSSSRAGIADALINFYSSDKLKPSKSEMTANDLDHVLGGRLCVPPPSHPTFSSRSPAAPDFQPPARSGDDGDGPSERDLSLGNATMWHVVFARLLGITGHVDLSESQRALCGRLGIDVDGSRAHDFEGLNGEKVWEVLARAFDGDEKRSA